MIWRRKVATRSVVESDQKLGLKMITKFALAAVTVLALSAPVLAQDAWAPWADDESAPAPQTRVTVPVQRVAQQAQQVQSPAPARLFRFERFWVVGSFR